MMRGTMAYTLTPTCYKVTFTYHPMLVKCIRRIPSARYHADGCWWEVSCYHEQYLRIMERWARDNRLVTAVVWDRDDERQPSFEPLPDPVLRVPHRLLLDPYPFQSTGIAYALEHKRCILGDEQGLGKTVEAIGVLTATGVTPALVICPASLKVNWKRELMKFGGLRGCILRDGNRRTWHRLFDLHGRDGRPYADVIITNYESLRKYFVAAVRRTGRFTLRSVDFDERIRLFRTVIVDESHKCKNPRTQQSKFVQGICEGKEYVLCLTGTPVVNNNEDLVQQLRVMGRLDDFGGYQRFMARYCAGQAKASHVKELNYLLRKHCFIRRQKRDVLTQLPPKTRSYYVTEITTRQEYKAAEQDVIRYLRDYHDASDEKIQRTLRGEVMVKMGILKQISARGKVQGAVELIHDTIDGGQKLIVFCFLREVVEMLRREFPKAVTVTGEDTTEQKQRAVDRFQTDDDLRLIILNYRSGGTGLTLTAASNVLFVEFPWTYADCVQAEDRAHRNGQRQAVNCVYLLGEGTIDEYLYRLIHQKRTIANGVTGTEEDIAERHVTQTDVILSVAMELFGSEGKKTKNDDYESGTEPEDG